MLYLKATLDLSSNDLCMTISDMYCQSRVPIILFLKKQYQITVGVDSQPDEQNRIKRHLIGRGIA